LSFRYTQQARTMSDFIPVPKSPDPTSTQDSSWSVSYYDLRDPIGDALDKYHQALYETADSEKPRDIRMDISDKVTCVATAISTAVMQESSHEHPKISEKQFCEIVSQQIEWHSDVTCMYLKALEIQSTLLAFYVDDITKHVIAYLKRETPDLFYHFVKK
jgi:hypothetical protein